eukprot:TRINITY_DN36260_c0_g1_i1.p1 TRINITY_DN36260_c0_g1~~TRINITY_DN36260_c0_g1_i1.p1  ORF type:complete len:741 (-),score=115.68 TRINITY_DN36260_c0_g1_i1:300-2522(-)
MACMHCPAAGLGRRTQIVLESAMELQSDQEEEEQKEEAIRKGIEEEERLAGLSTSIVSATAEAFDEMKLQVTTELKQALREQLHLLERMVTDFAGLSGTMQSSHDSLLSRQETLVKQLVEIHESKPSRPQEDLATKLAQTLGASITPRDHGMNGAREGEQPPSISDDLELPPNGIDEQPARRKSVLDGFSQSRFMRMSVSIAKSLQPNEKPKKKKKKKTVKGGKEAGNDERQSVKEVEPATGWKAPKETEISEKEDCENEKAVSATGDDTAVTDDKGEGKIAALTRSQKSLEKKTISMGMLMTSSGIDFELQAKVDRLVETWPLPRPIKRWVSRMDGPLSGLVSARAFEAGANLVIFAHVAFIGVHAQHNVEQAETGVESSTLYDDIDFGFSIVFATECCLRIFACRASYFLSNDKMWNYMDLTFVLLDVVNTIIGELLQGSEGDSGAGWGHVSSLRGGMKIVRLCRAGRALRVFRAFQRFEFSGRISVLVYEIAWSCFDAFYLAFLFGIIMLFFGIIFMQAATDSLLQSGASLTDQGILVSSFGSVPLALQTLFMVVSGGSTYGSVHNALNEVGTTYGVALLFYVFFIVFSFGNCVTSMFVHRAFHTAADQKDNKKLKAVQFIRDTLFAHYDDMISFKDFHNEVHTEGMKRYLATLDLEASEACGIFELLDESGLGSVGVEDLSRCCFRFARQTRGADLVGSLVSTRQLLAEFRSFKTFIHSRFVLLGEVLAMSLKAAK